MNCQEQSTTSVYYSGSCQNSRTTMGDMRIDMSARITINGMDLHLADNSMRLPTTQEYATLPEACQNFALMQGSDHDDDKTIIIVAIVVGSLVVLCLLAGYTYYLNSKQEEGAKNTTSSGGISADSIPAVYDAETPEGQTPSAPP